MVATTRELRIRLPEQLMSALDAEVERTGMRASYHVAQALTAYLRRYTTKEEERLREGVAAAFNMLGDLLDGGE